MARFAVYVCEHAHKVATNVLFALIEGEDPLTSFNVSQPASTNIDVDGSVTGRVGNGIGPATHWFGGRPVDLAWLAIYANLPANLPIPAGGWPLMDGEDVVCTEAQAEAAAAALYINVAIGEDVDALPPQAMAVVVATLGIAKIILGD